MHNIVRNFVPMVMPLVLFLGCAKIYEEPQVRVSLPGNGTFSSTVPVLSVVTADGKGITEKTAWKDASVEMYSPDGETLLTDMDVMVKGRGNSSWTFPKKPFNLRLDGDYPVLGMVPASKWCLLANWRDPTLMRNAVALEIARLTSLDWTPSGEFVDVVLDGTFMGNYYLTEKVDIGEAHVNVGTDGFLVCIDSYYDETYRFKTSRRNLPVNVATPSGCALDEAGFNRIRNSLDEIEDALYAGKGDWKELIDIRSFCDWFIVHELTENDEPNKPHSVYLHKHDGGPVEAGPCWDFDYHTFRTGISGFVNGSAVWYDALFGKPEFCALLKERWAELRPLYGAYIPEYIDLIDAQIAESARLDCKMWPCYRRTNGDETLGYDSAVEKLRKAFLERLVSMDLLISAL